MSLGDRMKEWEHAYRDVLDTDDFIMLRLDGKAFHTYTRGLDTPYDTKLMYAMDETMKALCEQIQGIKFGYTQSDEISLFIARENEKSEFWMGGNIQKILSLSAAIATAEFNRIRSAQGYSKLALFDSRLWTFPYSEDGVEEVQNYFLWRQRDAIKNSVTMAAMKHFSHKFLDQKNTAEKQYLLNEVGDPWEALPLGFRQGRMCRREERKELVSWTHKKDRSLHMQEVVRKPFVVRESIDFSKDSLMARVPA